MKKIILIFLMIGIHTICQATPWQDYGTCCNEGATTWPSDDDMLMLNDISDTTDNADGTLMQVPWSKVQPRDADLTSIAALSTSSYGRALLTLAEPDNGQLLIGDEVDGTPQWGYITETGDSLTVSNGPGTINLVPHANLEAISDACAGSTSPEMSLYYSLNDGTDETCGSGDKLAGSVTSTCPDYTGANEDTEDCDLTLWSMNNGIKTERAEFTATDGGGGEWDLKYPVIAPSINAGVRFVSATGASYSMADGQAEADNCLLDIYVPDGGEIQTIQLNDSPLCTTGTSKVICIFDQHEHEEVRITPHSSDYIIGPGFITYDQGNYIENDTSSNAGDYICLKGTAAGYWVVWDYVGTWTEQDE